MSDDLASGRAADETPNDLEMRHLFEQLGMRKIILEHIPLGSNRGDSQGFVNERV